MRRRSVAATLAVCVWGAAAPPAASLPVVSGPQALSVGGAPVLVLRLASGTRVTPVAGAPRTVVRWMTQAGAVACLNGGFFNHSNGAPVSHVLRGGTVIDDPRANQALVQNAVLRPHLPAILDARSAWLSTPSGWLIAPWRDRPTATTEALQAGPALLPTPALAVEAFRFQTPGGVRDGIQSRTRAPRSALGLCPDGTMAWVAVGAPGLTIAGLAALMHTLGCRQALALDGGSSTGLAWYDPSGEVRTGPRGQGGAAVRSALVVLPPRDLPR